MPESCLVYLIHNYTASMAQVASNGKLVPYDITFLAAVLVKKLFYIEG